MNVIFSKTDDSDRVINKTLLNPTSVNMRIRNDFNISSPELLVRNKDGFNISDFNYLTIPDLQRQYIINDVEYIGRDSYKVYCTLDYLETFKNDILNSNCLFSRNIKNGDYQNINIDTESKTIELIELSTVTIEDGSALIMTTITGE